MTSSKITTPWTGGFIVAGGRQVPCALPVEQPSTHHLTFPGLRPRRVTDLVVCHWSGGEGDADRMHSTLRDAEYSVQFFIDAAGTITQFCDADMLCSHATGMNARAVGIEIANRASYDPKDPREATRLPKRTLLREKIRGSDVTYTSFLPAQVRACHALVIALCEAYGLPLDVPRGADGGLNPNELKPAELAAFRGVVGHYHWSPRRKQDPGLALLRSIAAIGPRGEIGLSGPAQ